jgi:hypothetical protein
VALWFLIYRKDEYINLKRNIENMTSKVNKQKEAYVAQTQSKSHEKKLSTFENQLKVLNQNMSSFRMKSTFLIGLFMIIMMSALGTEFQGMIIMKSFIVKGIVVARLPFEPFALVRGMTHRGINESTGFNMLGLIGEDYTECSYLFIYILTSFVFRTNLQKIFGIFQ